MDEKERARLSVPIETNMATLALATPEQIERIGVLTDGYAPGLAKVTIHKAGFDLPDGYVTFRLDFVGGSDSLFGGIAPDGSAST